jgi:ribosomal protein L37AE/L43A
MDLEQKIATKTKLYTCEICEYNTNNKYDFSKHLLTPKHKSRSSNRDLGQKIAKNRNELYTCSVCDKSYKSRNGLWYHEKKCKTIQNNSQHESVLLGKMVDTSIVIELLKQNQEFKNMMIEQQHQLLEYQQKSDHRHDQLIEAVKDGKIGNTTNNHNTTNNKFNLNVFLNEKCKNAMSLTDFVNSMNLTIEDFIQTGERGFIAGISNIIIDRIHNMDLLDRPLHCTDLKRETVYIKDTHKWEKDEDKDKLRKAVKMVAYKNERIRPIWYEETPDVDVLGSENCEKFLKYSQSALGGCGREETKQYEDKIIKNILKETVIDKNKLEN